ncbi:MAG: hypothetical protein KDI73_07145 [Candidatus Competibacteraceae bacterium]|nr:hypothetical protein [Candidatus Competibacteraceae bacterium]
MSFEMLADSSFQPRPNDWLQQGAHLRRTVRQNADLTTQRTAFLSHYAIANAHGGKGEARLYPCHSPALTPTGLNTSTRTMAQALAGFPRYSTRLLLTFRLLTPLLTKDDDPFYLFENPARKDHLLGLPYLSAASVKGLSADAYQRAFPGGTPWTELSESDKDPDRTRAFRTADPHARRLFGIADDGANIESEKGRLHFSPVWFNKLQLLVMNPGDPTTAMGTQPIQFEAIAPGQTGVLEVVYFNPRGIKDSDEITVRADLARWLAAVATWWPALGLGAKRLAGYGAIQPEKAVLQAVGWSGMGAGTGPSETSTPTIPDDVREFQNEHGELVPEGELENRLALLGESRERLKTLIKEKEQLQARKQELQLSGKGADKELKQVKKDIERINKEKEQLTRPLEMEKQKLRARYRNAQTWLKNNAPKPDSTDTTTAVQSQPILEERMETGPESWLNLAHWIAE